MSTASKNQQRRMPAERFVRQARDELKEWMESRGWKPFLFQRQTWKAIANGESGLIHSTTGTGKTYAAWLGALLGGLARQYASHSNSPAAQPFQVLWLTPLRALAADTVAALQAPLDDLQLAWTLDSRTGDTTSSSRSRQRKRLPTALVTTPESLSSMFTWNDAEQHYSSLRLVIVDEWHELLASKRGVQTELALARLRKWNPDLQVWGLSATLGNLSQAMQVLLGNRHAPGKIIHGLRQKRYIVESQIPKSVDRFPWAGHLGLTLVSEVAEAIDRANSSLVFTNTRSQTESWYQSLLGHRPDWAGRIALHHGSLDRENRDWVEANLREGTLKCVVCTSSLDLGVDYSPVEQVFQVGSPKGVARLMQRAGRSGHSPDRKSTVRCVPTNALELVEMAAARDAISAGHLEARCPPSKPLDVLTQHVISVAVGTGFEWDELLEEVRSTHTYSTLSDEEWTWILDFVTTGGEALRAYPEYRKVRVTPEQRFVLDDKRLVRQHRLSIGTIVSDASLAVQFVKGGRLGTVEEAFLAKINPGDQFVFAGRVLELVRVQDSKVWVRLAKKKGTMRIPRWMGGRMPFSTRLADAVRLKLEEAADGNFTGSEMQAVKPLLQVQQEWSAIPRQGELLIEQTKSREGHHLYIYPFAGRLVHEGLASLFAYRLAKREPLSFSMSVNDYGLELLCTSEVELDDQKIAQLLTLKDLEEDITACLNSTEMAKRQFREIAHIAGLVFNGYPGSRRTARQAQASTGLLYDVFANYTPDNLLLKQAQREVLELQLQHHRLVQTLEELQLSRLILRRTSRFTPLAFPLLVDRLRERLTTEKLVNRVKRLQEQLEKAAADI